MAWLRDMRPAMVSAAPSGLALLTAAMGVMLLASGATPSDPSRFMWLAEHAPILLIEISHFLSSIVGILLILLAFGLSRRLDAAWAATVACLPTAAILALCKGFDWEEASALMVSFLLIAPMHEAFPRRARLTRMEISPGWLLSAAAAMAGAALAGWWSFQNLDYTNLSVIKVMSDHDAERAIRSTVAAAVLLLGVGVWRLLATPATPPVVGETDPEYERVNAILAKAECAEPHANLALRGDKRFLFSESGESFMMFGVRGRSWIALGSPIGKREERLELLWRFRELADAHAARPGVYGLGPDDLPDIVELGFTIQKVGETAAVPLDSFSLEGRKRGNLRRSWRKTGEEGGCFEVLSGVEARFMEPELRRISDQWLSHHAGSEKTFTMGGFAAPYVWQFPIAIVRMGTRPVAFATLWTTAQRTAFSIDLMRYADEAPKDVMDYLFVELLKWGREQGYVAFEFGMAPLAGLEQRPLAPILSRVGRLLFERGEEIYNFRGVRRYKDKYDPVWVPRYIAAPSKWSIPFLIADVGILTSGGFKGVGIRPRKALRPRPSHEPAPAA
ncbi:MAG TPA: bifunctional lysylphosphatidylglycerol flippase/synthetase MprF [Caulobacteraceae bacterium]